MRGADKEAIGLSAIKKIKLSSKNQKKRQFLAAFLHSKAGIEPES